MYFERISKKEKHTLIEGASVDYSATFKQFPIKKTPIGNVNKITGSNSIRILSEEGVEKDFKHHFDLPNMKGKKVKYHIQEGVFPCGIEYRRERITVSDQYSETQFVFLDKNTTYIIDEKVYKKGLKLRNELTNHVEQLKKEVVIDLEKLLSRIDLSKLN